MASGTWKSEQIEISDGVTVEVSASVDGVSTAHSTKEGVLVGDMRMTPEQTYAVSCAQVRAAGECLALQAKQ